jgi:hypothetical protein
LPSENSTTRRRLSSGSRLRASAQRLAHVGLAGADLGLEGHDPCQPLLDLLQPGLRVVAAQVALDAEDLGLLPAAGSGSG